MSKIILNVKNVASGYGQLEVVRNISFYINEGEIVCLLGANGSGKTTIMRAVTGLSKCFKGDVTYMGNSITRLSPAKIFRLGISHVPEDRKLFDAMTVKENLELGAFYSSLSKNQKKDMVDYLYQLFPKLKDRSQQIAGTLSGGEQQMLTIARALISKPKLIMIDEPSLGLAPLIVKSLFSSLRTLNESGLTILLVEQDVKTTLGISHRGYVLENGSIVKQGTKSELLESQELKSAYLA